VSTHLGGAVLSIVVLGMSLQTLGHRYNGHACQRI